MEQRISFADFKARNPARTNGTTKTGGAVYAAGTRNQLRVGGIDEITPDTYDATPGILSTSGYAFVPETGRHVRQYGVLLDGAAVADMGDDAALACVCTLDNHRCAFTRTTMFNKWPALVCPACKKEADDQYRTAGQRSKLPVIIVEQDLQRVTDKWAELAPHWRQLGDVAGKALPWLAKDQNAGLEIDAPVLAAGTLLEHLQAVTGTAGTGAGPGTAATALGGASEAAGGTNGPPTKRQRRA
jgi:hypothetical protein